MSDLPEEILTVADRAGRLTEEQRQMLYHLHRSLKGSFLQFDKLCRDLHIVTSTKG